MPPLPARGAGVTQHLYARTTCPACRKDVSPVTVCEIEGHRSHHSWCCSQGGRALVLEVAWWWHDGKASVQEDAVQEASGREEGTPGLLVRGWQLLRGRLSRRAAGIDGQRRP